MAYPYFQDTPWLENSGMGYLSGTYDSPTFTSFTHTVSDIIGGVLRAGLRLERFEEYAHDVGITPAYDGRRSRSPICCSQGTRMPEVHGNGRKTYRLIKPARRHKGAGGLVNFSAWDDCCKRRFGRRSASQGVSGRR